VVVVKAAFVDSQPLATICVGDKSSKYDCKHAAKFVRGCPAGHLFTLGEDCKPLEKKRANFKAFRLV
jgi:hypothetical protein